MVDEIEPTSAQTNELRKLFFAKLEKDGAPESCKDGFHPMDIERIESSDKWLSLFLKQYDLDMKESLLMLWSTCEWRKTFGTNDITENSINMTYINDGLSFPRNRDVDGKVLFIHKSKLHFKGMRNTDELLRIFVYWMERFYREEDYDLITIFFDLAESGISNMDLNYTKTVVNILKNYYPNAVNYILVYELPWVLNAAFKIIKAMLPKKAVDSMRFVNSKNLGEYVDENNQLKSWGGTDDYTFKFIPEKLGRRQQSLHTAGNEQTPTKKVHFANLSMPDTPLSDSSMNNTFSEKGEGVMLRLSPHDAILFEKSGNEMVGTVEIINIIQTPVTYKIKTTSPEKFRVRPSTGVLAPGANTSINVVLQQGQNVSTLSKDKFLVMCMELSSDASTSLQDITDLWKVTSSNSANVEQHRLKCWPAVSYTTTDSAKNGNLLNGTNLDSFVGGDRQMNHLSSTVSELAEVTRRLESQVKFNQTLQWITLLVFLFLSVAIVYILKSEIKNSTSGYCSRRN